MGIQEVVFNTKVTANSISTRTAMGVGMPWLGLLVQRLRRRRGRQGKVVLAFVHGLTMASKSLIIALAILLASGALSWTETARAKPGVIALHKLDLLVTI